MISLTKMISIIDFSQYNARSLVKVGPQYDNKRDTRRDQTTRRSRRN